MTNQSVVNWRQLVRQRSQFNYIYSAQQLEELIADLGEEELLALDTETYVKPEWKGKVDKAIDPHTCLVSVIAIKGRQDKGSVIDVIELKREGKVNWDEFIEFLQAKKRLLAFNAKFDLKMMRATFGVVLGNFWCVRVLVKMIGNALGSKFARKCGGSLEDVIRDFLSTPQNPIRLDGKGKEQISDWYSRPNDTDAGAIDYFVRKVDYAGGDTKYLIEIFDLLMQVICGKLPRTRLFPQGELNLSEEETGIDMEQALEEEQQTQVAIAEMEWNGLPFNKPLADKFYNTLGCISTPEGDKNRLGGRILSLLGMDNYLQRSPFLDYDFPREEGHKILRNPTKLKNLIINKTGLTGLSDTQTKNIRRVLDLFAEADKLAKDSDKTEIEWANDEEAERYAELESISTNDLTEYCELLELIVRYKQIDKVLGMDLRSYVNPVTGRIHSSYDSVGASTSRTCIAVGQQVMIPGGWKPIEEINVGDYVYCYKDEGTPTLSKVSKTIYNGRKKVVKVKWQNSKRYSKTGSLICTADHLILTRERGWVEAKDLKRYEKVFHLCAEKGIEYSNHKITSVKGFGTADVYDLEVENYHNFIVEDLCVHNCSFKPNAQQINGRVKVEVELKGEDPYA